MTSNQKYSPLIEEALTELAEKGLESLGPALERLFNELMLIEREKTLKASAYERTDERRGYANGFKDKMLHTRIGKLQLQVPKARNTNFYPSCLEKGKRSERALWLAMAQMYTNGVSTRRVERITKKLCDFDVSSAQVSRIAKNLDEEFEKFRNRPLESMSYIYLDARYEKVRESGTVQNLAILTAIGVNAEGRREVIGVSCALSEAEVHWRHFLQGLLKRGLMGVKLIVSDDHAGLKKARQAVLPGAMWQKCLFHLAQNAQAYAPNKTTRQEVGKTLRDIYNAPTRIEASDRLKKAVDFYESKAPRLSRWLEENCEESFSFYAYPEKHWKKIRTNNVSERLNQEIKRRTRIARLFPNPESALRVATAVIVEIHEEWVSGNKYLEM